MFTQNNNPHIRKIQLKKVNDQPAEILYTNNDRSIYRKLNNEEFSSLFEKIRPSIDFSLPDRLIQDLVHDNQFIPKFIESRNYTTNDLKETIKEGNVLTAMDKLMKKKNQKKKPVPPRKTQRNPRKKTKAEKLKQKISGKSKKKNNKTKKHA
jgi:hypothetical protein